MIYYSHINEDNRIERSLLQQSSCATVMVICGSGERVLSLMDIPHLEKLLVVDNNEEALFLFRLKLTALACMSVSDYLAFVGQRPLKGRLRLWQYDALKILLPAAVENYWSKRRGCIAKGILYAGHFERFLNRIRPATRFYLGKGFQSIFQDGQSSNTFPEKRWRLLKTIFSQKLPYQLAGNRDEAFIGDRACTALIPAAFDSSIKKGKAASSFMAHLVFKGHLEQMHPTDLPPSLQEDVLTGIQNRLLHKELILQYQTADLFQAVKKNRWQFCFFSVSDILSFADFFYLQKLVSTCAGRGNILVGRSFLRNRLTEPQLEILQEYGKLTLYDAEESTGMYQVFSIHYQQ